jgi:hypothetical protein
MLREFIFFIAYKACSGKSSVWGKNPFQYRNAVRLISILFFFHILQMALLIIGSSVQSIGKVYYLIGLGILLFLPYLIEIVFTKKILARSITAYKETSISKNAKIIAYAYFVLNFTILLAIVHFLRPKYHFPAY